MDATTTLTQGDMLLYMRVSEYFSLRKSQPYLDFVDIPVDTDVAVFVTPSALQNLRSTWGHECKSLVQYYFELVLAKIKSGQHSTAKRLLSCLNEQNEFHLGFSAGRSQGRAFGYKSADSVWGALTDSAASTSGLLTDLEDTCLFIEGIGIDMISDAICNIIRGPLIKYTQDMCEFYGIDLTPDVSSGPIWNPDSESWEQSLIPLPIAPSGSLLLIPKIFVRHKLNYDHQEYYRHFLLPQMQQDEVQKNTSLVELLADGTPHVTKTALQDKYGANKLAVVEQSVARSQILEKYKQAKESSPPPPLGHELLAEIEGTKPPDWDGLLDELGEIPSGRETAAKYEHVIEKILSSLFYPSLCKPEKQHKIHEGRKRIDITYTNESTKGFFYWLAMHYPSAFVFIECKNYGSEVGNPEIDQLAGRFSPSRGQFGILVCRTLENVELLEQRCIDTAKDHRGWIISLTDSDLISLVLGAKQDPQTRQELQLLKMKFQHLVE